MLGGVYGRKKQTSVLECTVVYSSQHEIAAHLLHDDSPINRAKTSCRCEINGVVATAKQLSIDPSPNIHDEPLGYTDITDTMTSCSSKVYESPMT